MAVTVNAFTGSGASRAINTPNFTIGRGSDAKMLIAQARGGYNDLTFASRDFYGEQPLFVDSTIKEDGDPLDQDYLDGSSGANATELGVTRVEGDTTVLTACDGTGIFYAGITQVGNPEDTAHGTAGATTLMSSSSVGAASGEKTLTLSAIPSAAGEPGRQIQVVFDATLIATNFQTGIRVATIEFIGTDAAGTAIRDQISVYSGDVANKTYRTQKYFRGAVSGTARGFKTAVMATITATNRAKRVIYTPQDERLVRFHGVEVDKPVQNAYYGMAMNSLEVNISGNSIASMVIGWMGMRLNSYQNLLGGTTPTDIDTLTGVNFAENNVFPGWSAALTVNGYSVPLVDATFSIQQNFTPSNVIAGVQHQAFPPYGAEKRDVMLSGNLLYSKDAEYNDIWKNRDFAAVVLSLDFNRTGMFEWQTDFVMLNAQLENSPDPDVSGRGEPVMPFAFKGKRRNSNADYYIDALYGNYSGVQIYTP